MFTKQKHKKNGKKELNLLLVLAKMEKKNYDKLVKVMEALKVAKIEVLETSVSEYGELSITLVLSKPPKKQDGNNKDK